VDNIKTEVKVQDAFRSAPYCQLRELTVKLEERGVVITGTVRSYYMKQCAQEFLRNCVNGHHIFNEITVVEPPRDPKNTETTG